MKDSEMLIQARTKLENLDDKKIELNDKIKINLGINSKDLFDDTSPSSLDREKIIELLSQAYSQREKIGAVNLTASDQYVEKKNTTRSFVTKMMILSQRLKLCIREL